MNENENYKILIVEDDSMTALYIQEVVKNFGFEILGPVSTGNDAIEIVNNNPPDLILMDIILKGELDGIDTVRKINSLTDIPVVYLTASTDEANLQRAKETRPFGFLIKPINEFELNSSIQMAVYRSSNERKVIESENKYRSLFEYLTDAFLFLKLVVENDSVINMEIIEANKKFSSITGVPVKDIIGKYILDIVPDLNNVLPEWGNLSHSVVFEKKPLKFKINFKKVSMSIRITAYSPWEEHLALIIEDITESVKAEKQIYSSELKYKELYENIMDAYARVDMNGLIMEFNSEFEELIGYDHEEIYNLSIKDITPAKWHKMEAEIIASQVMKRGYSEIYEKEYFNKIAGIIPVELRAYLMKDENGKPSGMWATIRDISERKKNEEKLKNANRDIENLLSSIDSILIGVTKNDIITHWNSVSEKTFHLSANEVIGKSITNVKIAWEWDKIYTGIADSMTERKLIRLSDTNFISESGDRIILGITINPIIDQTNELTGFLIYGKDITDKKMMEMQLYQDQKLKSIGELAAGIAHEINTPTQYVNNNTVFLQGAFNDIIHLINSFKEKLFNNETDINIIKESFRDIEKKLKEIDFEYLETEIPEAISQSLEGLGRIAGIVNSMKNFSHPGKKDIGLLDINASLKNTITISKNEWKYFADLKTNFEENLPEVMGYPAELNQVFLNIIINASHAIQDAINKKQIEKGEIEIKTVSKKDSVTVSISDNGTGIPKYYRNRILDPFFTTKEVGQGTGQGLAIAYSIVVNKHKGSLTFESEENEGTTFYISLPIKQKVKEKGA